MKRKRNGSRESDDRCYVDDFTLNKLKQIFPTLPSGRMYRGRCWLRTPYDEHNSQSPRHFVLGPGFSPKAMHSSSESSSGTESDSGSSSKSSSEDEKTTRRVSAHKISNLKKDESKQPQNLVVSGMDVVKKIEQVGTAKGEPDGLVKIVDCGEVSKKKIHDLVGTEKGKKKKTGKAPTSENDSDGPAIGRHRKSLNDKRKKRKRRYASSDSSSSDTDSSSYSSDSDSESDSSLSDSSSSSDGRRRKRRRSTKRDKDRYRRKRKDGRKQRRRGRRDKRSRRGSKLSSESSSGTESDSGSSSKSSSEDEKTTRRVSAHKISKLKKDESKQPQNLDVLKRSPPPPPPPLLEEETAGEPRKDHELKMTKDNSSDEEGGVFLKNDKLVNNGHSIGSKSDKTATQHSYSDNSSKSRSPTPIPKRSKIISPRPSPKRNPMSPGVRQLNRSPVTKSGKPGPEHKAFEPSASNHGRDASRNTSPNGAPTRIRKGRGFTEKYSSARRYRTPSPELAPRRYHGYGGRYFSERNRDRYTNYRPQGYDRSPPRGRSPPRYRSRRSRSRSISRSPGGYRGRGRDRTRSPSPTEKPLVASERLRSRLGPRVDDWHGSD